MIHGVVYKITNIHDGKCYIGQTINLEDRILAHKRRFSPKDHTFEILATYNSEEDLKNAENYWIWKYNAIKEGYNMKRGYLGLTKIQYHPSNQPRIPQGFSLELDLITFIDEKHWEYKMSRSQIVNIVLRYFMDHPSKLNKIIKDYKKDLKNSI